ncbi:hypothetical protein [Glycomyces xiaoerkulensis]|uniref:hypothetical protein n=1 Tax=Glycomyces xiaoerkulensis TaxID=2038139 RepID=UPI000C26B533|nr:hypothetical protein [Glycomyces xiaoerkulensis]
MTTPSNPADETPAKKTDIVFGVVFDLNGTHVPVSTKDIANARANGIEFTLPEAVELGTMNEFETWFSEKFKMSLPKPTDMPPPLDEVLGKLANLKVTVRQFHVKIPGTGSSDKAKLFTISLSGAWPENNGVELIPGVLSIGGVVFGVSNE